MDICTFRHRKKESTRPSINPRWWLRDTEADFEAWWRSQGKDVIFFDDASKGNPGRAGASRVIYSSNGNRVESFSWGLGQKTNSHA